MRKLSVVALLLCFVLGTAVVAVAKGTTKHATVHHAKGSVATVDSAGNSFTVKGKTKDETYQVTSTTKLQEKGKPITLSGIKEGDTVEVWYTVSGTNNEATKVIVLPAPPAKG
jgi:uncharacterized protein DUF5666